MNVSIPSEVGRGQARTSSTCRRPWNRLPRDRFNPLGGGAGSGSFELAYHIDTVRLAFRFNPLGGGAGSGSPVAATTGLT